MPHTVCAVTKSVRRMNSLAKEQSFVIIIKP